MADIRKAIEESRFEDFATGLWPVSAGKMAIAYNRAPFMALKKDRK